MEDDGLFTIEEEPQAAPQQLALVKYDERLIAFKQNTEANFRATIEAVKLKVTSLLVINDEAEAESSEVLNQVKLAMKEIEKVRKREVEEPGEYVKAVNKFCKSFSVPLDDQVKIVKAKLKQYEGKKEELHQKALKKAREERERLQAQLDKEAKEDGVQSAIVPDIPIERTTTVRTAAGTTFKVEVLTFEILDEKLIPREYLSIDERKIRAAVKEMKDNDEIKEIPGVRIYKDFDIRSRT